MAGSEAIVVPVSTPALLLVAHGSPNPGWREPLEQVRDRARQLAPDRRVELCFLERSLPDIPTAIESLYGDGVRAIEVVAVLLSGGGRHMSEDLPRMLEHARRGRPDLRVALRPQPLGADARVIEALARVALDGHPNESGD
jgi:sirohydrochlorin cobaltochelatase